MTAQDKSGSEMSQLRLQAETFRQITLTSDAETMVPIPLSSLDKLLDITLGLATSDLIERHFLSECPFCDAKPTGHVFDPDCGIVHEPGCELLIADEMCTAPDEKEVTEE